MARDIGGYFDKLKRQGEGGRRLEGDGDGPAPEHDASLVGVPLTTRQNSREAQISIGTGDWDPKRRRSYARIWRMLDIDAERTRREGAVLGRDRFDAVVAAVDEYYDVRRPADHDDFDVDD